MYHNPIPRSTWQFFNPLSFFVILSSSIDKHCTETKKIQQWCCGCPHTLRHLATTAGATAMPSLPAARLRLPTLLSLGFLHSHLPALHLPPVSVQFLHLLLTAWPERICYSDCFSVCFAMVLCQGDLVFYRLSNVRLSKLDLWIWRRGRRWGRLAYWWLVPLEPLVDRSWGARWMKATKFGVLWGLDRLLLIFFATGAP